MTPLTVDLREAAEMTGAGYSTLRREAASEGTVLGIPVISWGAGRNTRYRVSRERLLRRIHGDDQGIAS